MIRELTFLFWGSSAAGTQNDFSFSPLSDMIYLHEFFERFCSVGPLLTYIHTYLLTYILILNFLFKGLELFKKFR